LGSTIKGGLKKGREVTAVNYPFPLEGDGLVSRPHRNSALQAFSSAQEGGALPLYDQLMGAAIMSALPVVILYMIFQRYLIGD